MSFKLFAQESGYFGNSAKFGKKIGKN